MPWNENLDGQVALLTGAGTGIGAATARALSAAGMRVALVGRRPQPLEALREELAARGGDALAIQTDVRDETQVRDMVERTVETFGTLDVLINNAGVFYEVEMEAMTAALWDETLEVNLRGAFLCAHAAWPVFAAKRAGHIVNVSSVSGVQPYPKEAAYIASKFGMNGLTAALALDGRALGIRVHAVCPGSVDTPIWKGAAAPDVLGRMMRAEDVAEAIRWLIASPPNVTFDPIVLRNLRDPWEDQ